jgi:3-dehydroquinate synthetase
VGGGVVTDMAGLCCQYKRGIQLVLRLPYDFNMVDAAEWQKWGQTWGHLKNMVGIYQPEHLILITVFCTHFHMKRMGKWFADHQTRALGCTVPIRIQRQQI